MARLGQELLQAGLIDEEQLRTALALQAQRGGRLGSLLVQTGQLQLELLAGLLERRHGASLPPLDWLQQPDHAALQSFSRALIEAHRLIPLRREGSVLHIATLDPYSPALLSAIWGLSPEPIKAHILPELIMDEWLWWLFRIGPATREERGLEPPTAALLDSGTPSQRTEQTNALAASEE